ncbi:MAG: type II secretion system protein [Phycisphaerae bacterium]
MLRACDHGNAALPLIGSGRRRAFTMIDVVVVMAIIVLLLAILVPSLSHSRELARRVLCAGNLRQWGVATRFYRDDYNDYLPSEGTYTNLAKPHSWFNVLPPYLGLPAYKDIERVDNAIKEFPSLHVWICPSKNLTDAFKSRSGKNQFHYGLNQVLDGLGTAPRVSSDTPGYVSDVDHPISAYPFAAEPHTVWMFDIAPNSPAGTPRSVANRFQRDFQGRRMGRFHGDYANVLYLDGAVADCRADDLVHDRDFRHGSVIWTRRKLFWGYRPHARSTP